MDITEFMTWWINQVIIIISKCFQILQNIEFMGTNLLAVITTIIIIGVALPVLLTLPTGGIETIINTGERIKPRKEKDEIRDAIHRQYINEQAKKIRSGKSDKRNNKK